MLICVYMRVYACICVVYAAEGGQEAGKGRKCLTHPPFKFMEKTNLKNNKVYSYTLLVGGEIFWNSNICRRLYMVV